MAEPARNRAVDAGKLRFLVVEDHEFQRNMLVRMLNGLQAKDVYTAADGRSALALLKGLETSVDVIISDLDMPTMDGMEFIRHLGNRGEGTSLILASGLERELLSSVETMATAYGIHLLGTIEKPVTPQKLQQLLQVHGNLAPLVERTATRRLAFTPDEISEGILNDEFQPFFQPKVDVTTGRVVGAEALARWVHPQLGVIPPSDFVSALENSGRIDQLMRAMLRKSAAMCKTLHESGHGGTIAVNLSLKSLHDVTLADQITDIVRRQSVQPRCIVLEITESAATTDIAKSLENLTRLRMKGFGLSIDDYGTGYSSLEQLTRIPFTELKIDQSFVTHAARRESARVILASSLEMSRKLKILAVAEGVETQENWDMLKDLKCDLAQGYFIARPMAAKAYRTWVEDWPKMHGEGPPDQVAQGRNPSSTM